MDPYTTQLSPEDETKFQQWVKDNGIKDLNEPDSFYDYRGFWKDTKGAPHPPGDVLHFPDTYKKPGHPTFSVESKYAKGRTDAGHWEGDTFVPAPQKQDYFSQFEEPKSDYFSQFEEVPPINQPKQDEGILSKAWNTISEPPEFVTKGANKLADYIDNPQGEGGYLKGFGAGAVQGASSLLSPLNIITTAMPESRLAKFLSGTQLVEGGSEIKKGHYLQGAADIGMGVLGLRNGIGLKDTIKPPEEEVPLKYGVPVEEPNTQLALPPGKPELGPGIYHVTPPETVQLPNKGGRISGRFAKVGGTATSTGEVGVDVPTDIPSFSMRERLKGKFPSHIPTDADGVVTAKKDFNLPPQIKDAEIVQEVPELKWRGVPEGTKLEKASEVSMPQPGEIPTAAVRKPVLEYMDGVKNGSIPRDTGYSNWLANRPKPGLAEKLKSEQGSILFKKIRGVDQKTADGIRQEIIDTMIQGGRLDLEGIYGKTPGVSRNQFNSIVDEIIDTGAVPKIAEQIRVNTPEPIQRLLGALRDSKINSALQAAQLSAERAQRFGEFSGALKNVEGKEGFFGAASKMSGEYGKISPTEFQLGQADTDALFKQIANNKRITPGEKLRAGFALRDLLDGTRVLQRNELQLMDRIYGPGVGDQIMMMHGGLGAVPIQIAKTANTMKSMMATFDLSAPFRQGAGLAFRKEFWNAFVKMHKYAGSHEAFMAQEAAMEAHPNYLFSRDAGLFTANKEVGKFEEQFGNSYLNDIGQMGPIGKFITAIPQASERAYVGFLNKLRFDTFNALLEKAKKAGLKTETVQKVGVPEGGFKYKTVAGEKIKIYNQYEDVRVPTDLAKEIAHYVNIASGRGDITAKLGLNKVADELNVALFSPRLIASRLTTLNPAYYVKASPFIRQEALKTLFAVAGASVVASSLGAILGAQIKLKPNKENLTNPDYAKVKFGNTRLDPNSGHQQYIVAATQFLTGQATSGDNTYDTSKFGQPGRVGRLVGLGNPRNDSFLENKMSPVFSFADKLLAGKIDPSTRQPYNMFPGPGHYWNNELRKSFTPLLLQDMADLAKNDSSLFTDSALAILANYGMGLQTYGSAPSNSGLRAPSMNTKP